MRRKKVTMRDVAERAKVSINTVSLTLKGSTLVHPTTKAAVRAAIDELGYVPNMAAQGLRQGIVRTIGLMIPDMFNPHFWDIAHGVEHEAWQHGYGVVLTSSSLSPERELQSLRGLLERRYDGLILATHFLRDERLPQIQELFQAGHPVVTFGTRWKGADCVRYYQQSAALLLLNHLYELGHRRIGFVMGVAQEGLADERLQAYHQFTQQHDLPGLIEKCGPTVPDSIGAAMRLLDVPLTPTAIVAVNDYLVLGVLRAAAQRGLRVPRDLSVAGFDNTSLASKLTPALTSVDVGGSNIGRAAARLLFERLAEPEREDQLVELPPRLVIRDSTARPRA